MTHAASSLCANFNLTVGMFDGCSIPVLSNKLTEYLLFGIIFCASVYRFLKEGFL